MNIPIFLSYPKPYLKVQEEFIERINKALQDRGLEPRTLGVTDYDMNAPLTAIRRLMLESSGMITIAFRRSLIEKGVEKPQSDIGYKEHKLSDKWLTSPFCQIEPAMAYQLGLPILIFREDGVIDEGVLEKGVVGIYMPTFDLSCDLDEYFKSIEWSQIIQSWEDCVRRVSYYKGLSPSLY